jgi:hypothetical protein
MSKYLRSGTFSELSVLSGPVENPFTFEENIEFYQNNGISSIPGNFDSCFYGGVLAPNGKIYGMPLTGGEILEIDPSNNTTKVIPVTGYTNEQWFGGVLGLNGKIYGMPRDGKILEIDSSVTPVKTKITHIPEITNEKFSGGVLAPNGNIYGMQSTGDKMLEIDFSDPRGVNYNLIPSINIYLTGGALGPNGKIYGIPNYSNSVVEIDTSAPFSSGNSNPADDNPRLIPFLNSMGGAWSGGVLGPNGKIYGIPINGNNILEIDPSAPFSSGNINPTDDNPKLIPFLNSRNGTWNGGALAPNGKIYGVPYTGTTSILEIDPENTSANTDISFTESGPWIGGVLAPNGTIYGITGTAGCNILTIKKTFPRLMNDWILYPQFNKL